MADNGSTINRMPLQVLISVEVIVAHLGHTTIIIKSFNRSEKRLLGKIAIEICLGEIKDFHEFLVIDVDA